MKTTASNKGRISNEALDAIIGDAKSPEDVFGRDGLLKRLTGRLLIWHGARVAWQARQAEG